MGAVEGLAVAGEAGRRAGVTVLSAQAHDLEQGQPYSLVRRLLTAHVIGLSADARDRALAAPAASAAAVLGLSASSDDASTARGAGESLFWLLSDLADIDSFESQATLECFKLRITYQPG